MLRGRVLVQVLHSLGILLLVGLTVLAWLVKASETIMNGSGVNQLNLLGGEAVLT